MTSFSEMGRVLRRELPGRGSPIPHPDQEETLSAAGRAGFVSRGVVYVLIGILALQVAFGRHEAQADRQGALQTVGSQPFGEVLLWMLVAGFACMALWRASLALLGEGGRKKTGSRILSAGRAVFYAWVCWGTAAFVVRGTKSDSNAKSQDWTATALKLPAGRFLVGAAGLVLAGVGIGIAVRAFQRHFLKKLDTAAMGKRTRQVVTALGVSGNASRGLIFTAAGVFVLVAAKRFDPKQAHGIDATLRSFAHTPAGPWLLAVVAFGLLLFGGFSFASARWRRLS